MMDGNYIFVWCNMFYKSTNNRYKIVNFSNTNMKKTIDTCSHDWFNAKNFWARWGYKNHSVIVCICNVLDAIIMPFTVFGPRIDLFTCQTWQSM